MLYIIKDYYEDKLKLIRNLLAQESNSAVFIYDAVLYFQHKITTLTASAFVLQENLLMFGNFLQLPLQVKHIDHKELVELIEHNFKIITL